jgi:hypothetical protein
LAILPYTSLQKNDCADVRINVGEQT